MIYNLDDMYISRVMPDGFFRKKKIEESAFYQCLVALDKNGIACGELFKTNPLPQKNIAHDLIHKEEHTEALRIFLDYINLLYENIDRPSKISELSYKQFLRLYQDIRDNGFNYELNPPIKVRPVPERGDSPLKFVAGNGQHRVSILKFLGYGKIELDHRSLYGEKMNKE